MRYFTGKLEKLRRNFSLVLLSPTVELRNSFLSFWIFQQKNAFFDQTLWRKVVQNVILHWFGQVDFYLDTKNEPVKSNEHKKSI